jgi:hypothetical protein
VRPTDQSGYRTVVMKEVPGELAYSLYASRDTNRPNAWARVNGTSRDATGSAALPPGAWSHLAATYDGSVLLLYVNGTEVASRPLGGAIETSANPLHIGGNGVWGEFFAGLIDEVRIYNRALSPTEIQGDMTIAVINLISPPPGEILIPRSDPFPARAAPGAPSSVAPGVAWSAAAIAALPRPPLAVSPPTALAASARADDVDDLLAATATGATTSSTESPSERAR